MNCHLLRPPIICWVFVVFCPGCFAIKALLLNGFPIGLVSRFDTCHLQLVRCGSYCRFGHQPGIDIGFGKRVHPLGRGFSQGIIEIDIDGVIPIKNEGSIP